ncbi:MAG: hypothetical protein OEZ36_11630 [Spirochaetota bacterium]|nr:hypothetical protein [Spirochaetota bacterium]
MAILLEGCDGSPVIWGRLGDYLIQRTKGGRLYIRKYRKPSNPQTALQQRNREVFAGGIRRWSDHEKLYSKAYWDDIARSGGFRDAYRAFLSSYMMWYQAKIAELSGEAAAYLWVTDTQNTLTYRESPLRREGIIKSNDLIQSVLKRRKTTGFMSELRRTLDYLRAKGWQESLRYGLLPQLDESREWDILRLGLLKL